MEIRFQPALHDLAQEREQDLVWLEQQGIIIERDMLRPTLAEPGKLRQHALRAGAPQRVGTPAAPNSRYT